MTYHSHITPKGYDDSWRMAPHPLALDFVPSAILNLFPKVTLDEVPEIHNYLRNRGISKLTYEHFDVRYNEYKELVFVFTNILGNPLGLIFRSITEKKIRGLKIECLEFAGISLPKKARAGAWFGMHLVNITEPLMIVEAEIDCMRAYEFGFTNVVSPGGMSVTKQQVRALYNKKIFIGFDSDEAGRTGTRQFINLLPKNTEKWIVDWGVVRVKDPGEIQYKKDFYKALSQRKKVE
jgi:DNA primase